MVYVDTFVFMPNRIDRSEVVHALIRARLVVLTTIIVISLQISVERLTSESFLSFVELHRALRTLILSIQRSVVFSLRYWTLLNFFVD